MTDRAIYRISVPLDDASLNALFASASPNHVPRPFGPILARSLATVTAWIDELLVGFVNLATDGGAHAFLLDPTVHAHFRRRGIGLALVQHAIAVAEARGCQWLHVDFVPALEPFYRAAGFGATSAGLIRLDSRSPARDQRAPMLIEGQAYCVSMGSDPERDGSFLELYADTAPNGHPLAECFYSARDRAFALQTYEANIPREAAAWLRAEATRMLV